MYTKAFALAMAAALLGVAAAEAPAVCSKSNAYRLSDFPDVDAVRFQTLDAVTIKINEDISKPTLVVYTEESNLAEPFKTLNVKVQDGELLIGAANNDRTQCIHFELPESSMLESILADDGTNVLLEGAFNINTLKLVVIKGNFYGSNDTSVSFNVQSLTLNNTGVGNIMFMDAAAASTDLEIINAGNGDTWFLGSANDVAIHHDGIGNVFLGPVSNEIMLQLTGQGEIATTGSTTLAVNGLIKHPYRVFYKDGSDKICADLEVDMGNDNFKPCVQSDDPVAEVESAAAFTFAG